MSLRVWLPLNGDLHNYGLSNVNIINNNEAAVDNNGKIGKCYSFNGNNQYIDTGYGNGINSKNISIALWIKPLSSLNNKIVISVLNGSNQRLYIGVKNDTYNISYGSYSWGRTSNAPVTINTWSHLVLTVDNNGKVLLYQNGTLTNETTTSSTNFSFVSNFFIGGRSDGYCGNVLLNDVRIYDHCLSAKEVEEIAKGLVLHYKLDDTFIEPTTNLISAAASQETDLTFTTSAYSWDLQNHTLSNTKYALSAFIDATNSTRALTGVQYRTYDGSAYGSWTIMPNTNVPIGQKRWINGIIDLTNATLRTTGYNVQIRWFGSNTDSATTMIRSFYQLEEKDHCTPWVLGGTTRAASTVVYNSSGYVNNGEVVGNLTAATDAPRYDVATNFATENDYIRFPRLFDNDAMNNEFTFSCWLYRDYTDATQRFLCYDLCSIYLHTDFKPRIAWNLASADLSYNNSNAWAPSTVPIIPVQTWTHLVWTFKDGVLCCYVNGERKARDDRSDRGTFIRGTRGASIGYHWIGKISDVRTYATALSDEQIKELYDTSMSIDASGNIYVREVVE